MLYFDDIIIEYDQSIYIYMHTESIERERRPTDVGLINRLD